MTLRQPLVRLACTFLLVLLTPSMALSQGSIRTQGRDVTPGLGAPTTATEERSIGLRDYREDMRMFIQQIGGYARGFRRDFSIVANNGLELLQKRQWEDETQTAPARVYMRSLDGVMLEGLYYGVPETSKPTEDKRQEFLIPLAEQAKAARLPVLIMDYAESGDAMRDAFSKISAKGFIPFVSPQKGFDLNKLPPYSRTPWGVNPNSVVSLSSVRNFVAIRDSSGFGRQDEFALAVHDTNFDMVVVDVFHGRVPLTKQAVETLRYKKLGAKRLILARVDIGHAEAFAHYWQDHWEPGRPDWLGEGLPGEPDRYRVEFWRPEWQAIITGNTQSYIYGAIDLGFDGIVLDGLDAFYFYEGVEPPILIQ